MKKQAIILAALIGAASAQAQIYGTVAGGSTSLDVECTGNVNCDSSDTGVKLVVGYDLGNGLSIEGGYISFGKASASLGTDSFSLKPTAFILGGAYALPFSPEWGMNVRLGLAQVKTKGIEVFGTQSQSASESQASVYAGVGVTYTVSKTIKLELGLDTTQAEFGGQKGDVRLISFGATFAF
jgi:OmpA-OmpF porin, OOP family